MPATALLPLTIAVSILLVLLAVVLWAGGRRGRGVQLLGLALLPPGLYFTGLLTLVWNAVAALAAWASQLVFNPAVWTGVGLLLGTIVLWFVGGRWAQHARTQRAVANASGQPQVPLHKKQPQVSGRPADPSKGARPAQSSDPEMDEIEAILRNRGIE